MTKEPIMINDVDVSECKHIIDYDPPEWQGTWGGAIHKGACKIYSGDCKCNPNCYYKQLKRKEQECERLKKKLNPKLKNAHCAYFVGQTGLCKAKEFTRCNPVNCKLYTIDELSTIVDLQEQLDQLKGKMTAQEIDESIYIKQLEKTINKIRTERDELQAKLDDVLIVNYEAIAERYKQALQEIKEIAKTLKKDICSYCDSKDTDRCDQTDIDELEQILQKCEGALNE